LAEATRCTGQSDGPDHGDASGLSTAGDSAPALVIIVVGVL
jgi:hypothetical protein